MSDTYRTGGVDRSGSSGTASTGLRPSHGQGAGEAGYPPYDVGRRGLDEDRGYAGQRSGYRAEDLVPVAGVLIGGAIGYMLAAAFSDDRSRSGQGGRQGLFGGRESAGGYGAGASSSGSVEREESTDLIASNKVEGTTVYNRQGEKLGEVYNFMVGKRSGRVAYAVLSFGGFLGIGQRYHALPWEVLTYDTNRGGYVIDADKDRLMGAPSHEAGKEPFAQSDDMRRIRDYWSSGRLSL